MMGLPRPVQTVTDSKYRQKPMNAVILKVHSEFLVRPKNIPSSQAVIEKDK